MPTFNNDLSLNLSENKQTITNLVIEYKKPLISNYKPLNVEVRFESPVLFIV